MAETLVRAAVTVLSEAERVVGPHVDPRDALAQSVSLFLRSLQDFPRVPLSFALEKYRDFFVLVARWRNEDHAEDARHTIDRERGWLENSTAYQRQALDRCLVIEPWYWGGPCDLTSRLLSHLVEHHAGADCAEQIGDVSRLLLDSIEVANDNPVNTREQQVAVLGLAAILLDAFAELDLDRLVVSIDHSIFCDLVRRAARILVQTCWRAPEANAKMAVGIVNRLQMRNERFSWPIVLEMLWTILENLGQELRNAHRASVVEERGLLRGITALYESCFASMQRRSGAFLAQPCAREHSKMLSQMLSTVLDYTADAGGDERYAELEEVAARLYSICEEVRQPPQA